MLSATRATALMKLQASTKSLNAKALWSLPAWRLQPGRALSRAAMSASVSLAGGATRGDSAGGRRAHDGRALDVLVPDLGDIEALDVVDELLEGLVEGRQGLALARERRGAREHEVLHVRVIDAALLDLGDHVHQRLVRCADQLRALLALLERLGEASLEELVHAAQDGRECAAREALVLLVEEPERDEVRRLELERVVLLAARRLIGHEAAVHADDLERFLLEVVGLLGVERQDLEGDLVLRHEDGRDHCRLELAEHGAAVVAVGRPVEAGLGRHDDDGVDEAVDLLDDVLEALDVGRRQIALIRRRLHLGHGQQAEDLPVVADRLAIERERAAAIPFDLFRQRHHRLRRIPCGKYPPVRHAADYARRVYDRKGETYAATFVLDQHRRMNSRMEP